MAKKRWKIKDSPDKHSILALADSLNISNILALLLIQRGITNFFEAKNYFRPAIESLYDPFLMDGMEAASRRVINAITHNEKICVYGDYDVDGTCAAALMFMFLRKLGTEAEIYIPNRLTEGYGFSISSIDSLKEKGIKLIISVDCGITAVEEIAHAKRLGIDTIICDHHQPKDELPDAHAILDPLRPGDTYPFKYLSGAGVAFKLATAVADRIGKRGMVMEYLDLVALAGAADIVPLTDENRILVHKGLELINTEPRPGIKALIKRARMEFGDLSAGKIVFTMAPRINAVGRLGDANRAVELFITDDTAKAEELASVLEEENFQRRKIDEVTFSHAVELVGEKVDLENEPGIVLHFENWHPGVIGIVASRLVEKYYRPSVMLTTIDGVAKGSARSIPGFNIYEALGNCEDLLVQFGGHEAAAGLAVEVQNLDAFKKRFNEVLKLQMNEGNLMQDVYIDTKISLSEITPKFIRILDQFAPFGPGNLRPVFLSEGVSVVNQPKIVGTNHLVLAVRHNGSDKVFDSIGFNLGHHLESLLHDRASLDIVYSIEKTNRDGKSFPQLRIKDLKLSEETN
jgi:single-stranded-DNA-specific exonuclease